MTADTRQSGPLLDLTGIRNRGAAWQASLPRAKYRVEALTIDQMQDLHRATSAQRSLRSYVRACNVVMVGGVQDVGEG